jgi:hypothetical protein
LNNLKYLNVSEKALEIMLLPRAFQFCWIKFSTVNRGVFTQNFKFNYLYNSHC